MTDKDSSSSLSNVRKWLEKQGYALEMRVAQAFENAGFKVSQSKYYLDKVSGNLREIDVVASVRREIGDMWVSVDMFIECKYAPRPWVVFTSQGRLDNLAFFSRVLAGRYDVFRWEAQQTLQGRLLASILSALGGRQAGMIPAFSLPKNIGYRMIESHRDGNAKDGAYTALMQVTNCIQAHDAAIELDFDRSFSEYKDKLSFPDSKRKFTLFCGIGFPVIFTRGHLIECRLAVDGEIALSQINESVVLVPSRADTDLIGRDYSVSAVRIITEDNLEKFAQEAYEAAEALLSQEDAMKKVWKHEFGKFPEMSQTDEIRF